MRRANRGPHRAMRRFLACCLILGPGLTAVVNGYQDSNDAPPAQGRAADDLIGNRSTRTYHRSDCKLISKLSARTKIEFDDAAAADSAGFKPCPTCKPEAAPAEAVPEGKSPEDATQARLAMTNGPLRFSRAIAPILAANCMNCHNAQKKDGEFDLSTFDGLLKGSQSGTVLVPGDPGQSLLVQMIESRKMPRGNRRLANEGIELIKRWVAEGAKLDASVSRTANLNDIKPSEQDLRLDELAKLTPEQRDAQVEKLGLDRLKQTRADWQPKILTGRNFLIFHSMPDDRAQSLMKILDTEKATLSRMVGQSNELLSGPEKLSVYVLNDSNTYTEFRRTVEQAEVELGAEAHYRFVNTDAPYIAAIDPYHGGSEPAAQRSTRSTRKKHDDDPAAPKRSLSALCVEQLAAGNFSASGKCPRWLSDGMGALFASKIDPRSPYLQRLRVTAAQQAALDWSTRSNEALGDQGSPDLVRAMGFSLCEWLANSPYQGQFGPFVVTLMTEGGDKIDDVIKQCFGNDVNRDAFRAEWLKFVLQNYGRR